MTALAEGGGFGPSPWFTPPAEGDGGDEDVIARKASDLCHPFGDNLPENYPPVSPLGRPERKLNRLLET